MLLNVLPFLLALTVLQPPADAPQATAPAAVSPTEPKTTDVDAGTTPAQAVPLDPAQAAPGGINDLLKDRPPVLPAPAPPRTSPARPATLRPTVDGAITPAFVEDAVVAPDGPLTDRDVTYQNRLLNSFQATQGRQGPLDGAWAVATPNGEIFRLQLSDPGAGEGRIEGAWRNLQRTNGPASGFIDSVSREGEALVMRFVETDAEHPTEVRLTPGPSGEWVGEAITPSGRQAVVMRPGQGVELAARAAPYVEPGPAPRASAGSARLCPKPVKARKGHRAAGRPRGCVTAKSSSRAKQSSASKSKKRAPAKKSTKRRR